MVTLVGRHDWYRSTSWNSEIEETFFKKLGRARDKSQYLRIQASILAPHHPEIALRLLEQYFALGDDFDIAQAHVDRATAFLHLNQLNSAILAYEAALTREANYPKLQTRAYIELPFLIATERLSQFYSRALSLLDTHKHRLMFPRDHFQWNCAIALIRSEQGDLLAAHDAAQRALEAALQVHSGFRYHPEVGLVGEMDASLRQRLMELVA